MKILAALGLLSTCALGACTVQPLYDDRLALSIGTPTSAAPVAVADELKAVAISAPSSRIEQQVRNHLGFLLLGGQTQEAVRYQMELRVHSTVRTAARIQRTTDDEPTAQVAIVSATYIVREASSGRTVSTGSRRIQAAFDASRQEFARLRAAQEAEERAARELAEFIRLALARDLARPDQASLSPVSLEEQDPLWSDEETD